MSRQNPGYYSIELGEVTVTALNDGMFTASTDLIGNLPGQDSERLLRERFRAVPPRISVSCFVLELPGHVAVVDFGAGRVFGDALGRAAGNLAALGVAPESVDTILLTHGHGDHTGGLLDAQGGAAFPRAELVVHETELAFWTAQPERDGGEPARKAFQVYGSRLRRVGDGAQVLPGVTLHPLSGHTPGHSGFMIASGGKQLLLWADTVNLPAILLAQPEATLGFDTDKEQGRATRRRTLDMAATDGLLVAGNHLDFPLFGHVLRRGQGFHFEPVAWAPNAADPLG